MYLWYKNTGSEYHQHIHKVELYNSNPPTAGYNFCDKLCTNIKFETTDFLEGN